MMDDAKSFVGPLELASKLGLPPSWVKTEAKAGRIPSLRVGRRRLFDLAAVRAALAERMTGGVEGPA